ncbi:MAG: glycosyltransferase, partial [Ferruginibacter sp.]
MKKTIIHFIFNLTRGGAETMLVKVIKELEEYDHIVVTLFNKDHFGAELQCKKMICMNLRSIFSLPLAVFKFKKIIREHNPALVHTHLVWPSMVARLATPAKIPLLTTIHTSVASAADYKKWYIKFFDKLTYKFRKSIIIVVAKDAFQQYFSFLKVKP